MKHRKRHDRKVVSILLHELANTLMALPWGDAHRFDITCLPGMPKPGNDESPYVQVVSRVDVRNALDALDLQKGVCAVQARQWAAIAIPEDGGKGGGIHNRLDAQPRPWYMKRDLP